MQNIIFSILFILAIAIDWHTAIDTRSPETMTILSLVVFVLTYVLWPFGTKDKVK